jgi:hypothetical protein
VLSVAIPCNPTQAQIDAAVAAPTVADNCSTGLQQHLLMVLSPVHSCARTMIRTWSAVDACGNTGTVQQTITYTRDVTAPTFTLGAIGSYSL